MNTTKTYTATSNNGTTFTRTTKTMNYQFVVVGRKCGTENFEYNLQLGKRKHIGVTMFAKASDVVEVIGWTQSQKGADTFARNAANGMTVDASAYTDIEIIAVG